MWILQWLPDSLMLIAVHGLLVVGIIMVGLSITVADKVFRFSPAAPMYRILFQLVSVLILSLGIYLKGGANTEISWRQKVADLTHKVSLAQEKSEKVNIDINAKVITNTRIIREKAKTIIQYIDRPVFIEFDKVCPLPSDAITLHNDAILSLNPLLRTPKND